MKIYDVRRLKEGMRLVAQRHINGELKRYSEGTIFEFVRVSHHSSRGYSEIQIRINGVAFKSYDDYFKHDKDQGSYFVIAPRCVFDEA